MRLGKFLPYEVFSAIIGWFNQNGQEKTAHFYTSQNADTLAYLKTSNLLKQFDWSISWNFDSQIKNAKPICKTRKCAGSVTN